MKKAKQLNLEIKIGVGILSGYFLWALIWQIYSRFIVGSYFEPYIPNFDIRNELASISSNSIWGTDIYGRSYFQVMVSFVAAFVGIVFGFLSTSQNSKVKLFFDFLINSIFIFPSILIAILIMSILGQSYWGLIFALSVTNWPGYAKISRGECLRINQLEYVEGAKAVGVGPVRLFLTVILPNLLPVVLVHFVLGISGVIISEASLGFLGLGVSEYSWGAMFSMSKTVLLEAPRLTIILSLCVGGLIIGLNLFSDGLRDYLDPKQK
jgi:peptide/nickel transport system permease protein